MQACECNAGMHLPFEQRRPRCSCRLSALHKDNPDLRVRTKESMSHQSTRGATTKFFPFWYVMSCSPLSHTQLTSFLSSSDHVESSSVTVECSAPSRIGVASLVDGSRRET